VFGEVFLGCDTSSESQIAVKVVRKVGEVLFDQEVKNLRSLNHQCIVGFCGYVPPKSSTGLPPIIAMEFVPGQNLWGVINAAGRKGTKGVSGWNFTQKLIMENTRQLDFLTEVSFMH
jgi:serine/threonine protein kinase